jgi:uncharacterized RDD family membrane protein YckC
VKRRRAVPAGVAARVIAYVIDMTVAGSACALIVTVGYGLAGSPEWTGAGVRHSWWLFWIYEVGAVAIWGRRLGDVVMRIRVVGPDGISAPGWWRSGVRWLLLGAAPLALLYSAGVPRKMLTTATLLWTIALLGSVIVDPAHRGIHDRAAGTAVVVATSPATERTAARRIRKDRASS